MPRRLFDRKELKYTPSYKAGISTSEEVKLRRVAVEYIRQLGNDMNLSYDMVSCAIVLMHHFYMYYAISEFDMRIVAVTCMMVAGKAEETPKKLRDLLRNSEKSIGGPPYSEETKERIVCMESVLLQALKFDVFVSLPHTYLASFAREFRAPKADIEMLLQTAWTFANDSLCTTLCLQWEPEIIAISVIYLAMRLKKMEIYDWNGRRGLKDEKWWDRYVDDLQVMLLEDICHRILDVYTNTPTQGKDGQAGRNGNGVSPSGAGKLVVAASQNALVRKPPLPKLAAPPQPPAPPPPPPPPATAEPALTMSIPMPATMPALPPMNFPYQPNVPPPSSNTFLNATAGPMGVQPPTGLTLSMLTSVPPPMIYPDPANPGAFLPYPPPTFQFGPGSVPFPPPPPPPPPPQLLNAAANGQPPLCLPPQGAYMPRLLYASSQLEQQQQQPAAAVTASSAN